MIDVSEGAAPTFGDLDGDGLPDMLIGNHADRVGTCTAPRSPTTATWAPAPGPSSSW